MDKKENEIIEEKIQEKKKKPKFIIIIVCFLISVLLVSGIAIAMNELTNNEEPKTDIKEEKEENKEETDEEKEEKEEAEEQPEILEMDDYFLNYDLKLTEDDRIRLINSTSIIGTSDDFIGAMFQEEISDEYKLYYTLSTFTYAIMEKENLMIYDDTLSLKNSTIEQAAKKIFVDFKMPTKSNEKEFLGGLYRVKVGKETTTFSATTFGITAPFFSGYKAQSEINGNVITVKPIYVEGEVSDSSTEEILYLNVTLYDPDTKEKITEIKDYNANGDVASEYNDFSKYYEKIDTYKYTFTDDNRLQSVEKE